MANKLAESVLVLKVDDREMTLALNQIPKRADQAATAVKGIGQAVDFAVFKELASITSTAFKTVIGAIVELGERGAAVDDVANSFSILTGKTGETADVMLGKLREGVVGTLSDYDLMVEANKSLGSGLIKTAEDMGALSAGARTLAKATGGTTKEAFDTLTTAIASGRTASLKQIGLFVDSKVALEDYSKEIGKSVSNFTDADRAQALAAASLAALRQRMQEVKPDAADFGELIEQAKVRLENFKDQLSRAVAQSPVFNAGMTAMGKALGDAFGSDQKAQVSGLTKLVEQFAFGLANVAQFAVVMGSVLATVFSAVEVLVNGVLTGVVGLAAGVATAVDGIMQLKASLPFASDASKELAGKTSELRQRLDAMTQSLAKSTAAAAKGVVGQGALHEKLDAMGGVIMRVRDAMESARGKTAELTTETNKQGKSATEAASRSQEAADKIAEAFRALNDEVTAGTKVGLERRLFEIEAARQKELDGLSKLKFETQAKHDEMEALINEKYRQRVEAARLAGDEIVAKEQEVQNAIALQLTSGTANKLLQIEIARQKEVESLAFLKADHAEQYAADVAAVNEKYRLQTEAAQGHYATVELMMAALGLKTRTELEAELENAKAHLKALEGSHEATNSAIAAQKKKVHDLTVELDGKEAKSAKEKFEIIHDGAFSMMKSLFGKNKTAAIAMTLIDTAAAVIASFKNAGGFPWGLIPAAAMAAQGAAQIKVIKSQDPGFAQGTPRLDFADFGAESFQPLHNQEAVIPRGGGHLLAGEIADAMPGQDEQVSLLRDVRALLQELPLEIRKGYRNALLLDMA